MIRDSVRQILFGTAALAAVSGAAHAQISSGRSSSGQAASTPAPATPGEQAQTAATQLQEVQVTATRIVRPGFVAPTPVTTMTSQDLKIAGYTSLGAAIQDMPMDAPDTSPKTDPHAAGEQGQAWVDLRGLGSSRTLTLIDGMRPVWTNPLGFDVDSIPSSIIQRVDIVTGGASAAWGSDAVAGVVNLVIDNKFDGVRADIQYGQDEHGYGGTKMVNGAFGTHFGPDERGHFLVAVQWTKSDAIPESAVGGASDGVIGNPNYTGGSGQPENLLVPNYNYAVVSKGGLIDGGPLNGTAFGPGGVPYAFQYGKDYTPGGYYMSGGDPEAISPEYQQAALAADTHKSIYSELSYDVFSNLTLTATFLYTHYSTTSSSGASAAPSSFTIQSTNAFLPPSIAQQMAADGISSFTLGRGNFDFGDPEGPAPTLNEQSYWGSVGARGSFGDHWSWQVYYDYGVNNEDNTFGPQPISALESASVNSILNPATGQPECAPGAPKNSAGASCVPVNLFGYGSPSAAAYDYFMGTAAEQWNIHQNEAGGELQGEPFSTWAGPVSVAGGGEWRTEALDQPVDPLSAENAFAFVNYTSLSGQYSVREGFAETVVPLLSKLPGAQEFDFNGAVRESDYSTSGDITSWKFGATDKATDEFLLRGSYSQDIRAPNIAELFSTQSVEPFDVHDPKDGNADYQIEGIGGGNPKLLPEIAHTLTYGGVYTPSWLPGFNLSLDWWAIDIRNVITAISPKTTINDCYAGFTPACANIVRFTSGPNAGLIDYVDHFKSNLNKEETSGLDAEATYELPLNHLWDVVPGTLSSHLLATYVDKSNTYVGTVINSNLDNAGGTALRWRAVLTETYDLRRLEAYVRLRYVSGGDINIYPSTVTLDQNHYAGQTYLDLGASYYLSHNHNLQIYANVVNVLNKQPPAPNVVDPTFYDEFGVTFNVGVRASF